MPITTPMGVEIEKKKAYVGHERKVMSVIMPKKAMPIAIAVNILCKHVIHKPLYVSAHSFRFMY